MLEKSHKLTKTPLIRGGRDIKFLSSSHKITPAQMTDVTAVLLHYKMAGDFTGHVSIRIARKSLSPGCVRRHVQYAHSLKEQGEGFSPYNTLSKRYESSDQLVKLGLINCPEGFHERLENE